MAARSPQHGCHPVLQGAIRGASGSVLDETVCANRLQRSFHDFPDPFLELMAMENSVIPATSREEMTEDLTRIMDDLPLESLGHLLQVASNIARLDREDPARSCCGRARSSCGSRRCNLGAVRLPHISC